MKIALMEIKNSMEKMEKTVDMATDRIRALEEELATAKAALSVVKGERNYYMALQERTMGRYSLASSVLNDIMKATYTSQDPTVEIVRKMVKSALDNSGPFREIESVVDMEVERIPNELGGFDFHTSSYPRVRGGEYQAKVIVWKK